MIGQKNFTVVLDYWVRLLNLFELNWIKLSSTYKQKTRTIGKNRKKKITQTERGWEEQEEGRIGDLCAVVSTGDFLFGCQR